MDSGNSGSIQSSSGGDEEYDSRAESMSSFLNPSAHIGSMTNPPQPPPPRPPPHHHHHNHPSPFMFDPLSNYFDPISRPPLSNSLLNFDPVWSKTLRSDPNCTEFNPMMPSTSSLQPFFDSQGQSRGPFTTSSPAATTPFPPVLSENTNPRASSSSATSDHALVVRNPKKRSRASRRAPTTVLTTDTTNFRAMVQEFTGIPAPPFTSSPFPRGRLDLFGTPSGIRSYPLDASHPPSYLLRPFAQKFQPLSFLSPPPPSPSPASSLSSSFLSSSMAADGIASANPNNTISTSGTSTTSVSISPSINYQSLLNMQNSVPTFQSLHHQSAPKYRLANPATQGSQEILSTDSHVKMGVLDEFGLSRGHVNHTQLTGLSNLFASEGTTAGNGENSTSWAGGVGSDKTDQSHLRSVNGNYRYSESVNNGKLNFSASSSNFHGEKGSENVPARGEGMPEPWICSSD